MMYPLVLELADDGIPVRLTCRVLDFSTQGFYKWHASPVTESEWDNAHLIHKIRAIHKENPEFGSERVWAELVHEQGLSVGLNRVEKLMRENKIRSVTVPKKPKTKKAGEPVHDDLVDRKFRAALPNQVWFADITEHKTSTGKLYMAVVMDACSGFVVGLSMARHMRKSLVCNATKAAIKSRPHKNTILHSDRGSQYRSEEHVELLKDNELRGSMGRVGACGDNAAMESFNSRLQVEVLDRQKTWTSVEELEKKVFPWVHAYYNRKRRKKKLGFLSPERYEAALLERSLMIVSL